MISQVQAEPDPSRSTVEIPAELIDYIIDYCHDDRQALSVFSLVCKGWVSSSRYHLFSRIKISERRALCFAELLNSPLSTLVPQYVYGIDLILQDDEHQTSALDDLIRRLACIPRVSLMMVAFEDQSYISDSIRTALRLNFATLTHLELSKIMFNRFSEFSTLLCSFPLLVSAILRIRWDRMPMPLLGSCRPSQSLVSLDVNNGTDEILQWFLSLDPVHKLSSVFIRDIVDWEIPHIVPYLSALGPALTHLHLHFMDDDIDTFCEVVNLSVNTKLRSLNLDGQQQFLQLIFKFIPRLLLQIQSVDMEDITLSIPSFSLSNLEELPWVDLEMALAHPLFSQLRRLCIRLLGNNLHIMDEGILSVQKKLPLCADRSILRFDKQLVDSEK